MLSLFGTVIGGKGGTGSVNNDEGDFGGSLYSNTLLYIKFPAAITASNNDEIKNQTSMSYALSKKLWIVCEAYAIQY